MRSSAVLIEKKSASVIHIRPRSSMRNNAYELSSLRGSLTVRFLIPTQAAGQA